MTKLTNTVREHRSRLGLTQAALAQRIGVSRQTVISIEGGDYTPSALLAATIARELGIPFDEVFRLEEEDSR